MGFDAMTITLFLPTRDGALSFCDPGDGLSPLWPHLGAEGTDTLWAFSTLSPAALDQAQVAQVDATRRFFWPDGAQGLQLSGLLGATHLGALVLWDLAHTMPVGARLELLDQPDRLAAAPILRGYFDGCFTVVPTEDPHRLRLEKTAALPAEADAGLDAWSFGVPAGKPDPALLAGIRDRVAEMGLPTTELLICCPEEHRDLLPDGWRLVPQPEGRPTLTLKKNLLAEAASHPNLCIFHDRVLLPRNFGAAMRDFGDHFPVTGLQNIYINPTDGAISRYSDYHVETSLQGDLLSSAVPGGGDARAAGAVLYAKYLKLRQSWHASFVEASPANYNDRSYLTGSLYLAKKSVWAAVRQNADIEWLQLEDVEFGRFAREEMGIPSRVNAYAFARTVRVRPILAEVQHTHAADTLYESRQRPAFETGALRGGEPPVFEMTDAAYKEGLSGFAARWVPDVFRAQAMETIFSMDALSARSLSFGLIRLMYLSQVMRTETRIRAFLDDFSRVALLSAYDAASVDYIVQYVMDGSFLPDEVMKNAYMLKFIYLAARRPLFARASLGPDRLAVAARTAWHDSGTGLVYPGDFKGFLGALEATI